MIKVPTTNVAVQNEVITVLYQTLGNKIFSRNIKSKSISK